MADAQGTTNDTWRTYVNLVIKCACFGDEHDNYSTLA